MPALTFSSVAATNMLHLMLCHALHQIAVCGVLEKQQLSALVCLVSILQLPNGQCCSRGPGKLIHAFAECALAHMDASHDISLGLLKAYAKHKDA